MTVTTGEQPSCVYTPVQSAVSHRVEATEDEHCCLTARLDASCVHSHCAEWRDAVQRSWMQLVWDGSGRTVADTLRRSCLRERDAFLQLDTSSARVAGRQENRQKAWLIPSVLPTLPFVLSDGSFFLLPNLPLITFYGSTLARWKKDAAPTLQVVSGEVHA